MKRSAISFLSIKNLVFFSILFFLASPALSEWHFQDSGTTNILMDIYFIDELHGWAVGYGSTVIVTDDGGETWARQETPVPYLAIENVQFINRSVGYCCGTGYFFSTRDGGETWNKIDLGYNTRSTWNLSFINENVGWLVIEVYNEEVRRGLESHILHTTDGGNSWERQFTYQHSLRGIDFIDDQNGWAIGSPYVDTFNDTDVFRTTNGGKDWTHVSTIMGSTKLIIDAYSYNSIWLTQGGLSISDDGGETWNSFSFNKDQPSNVLYGRPNDIIVLDNTSALIRFAFLYEDHGVQKENVYKIMITRDSGNSFTEVFSIPMRLFGALDFYAIDSNNVWVVDVDGKIIKYTNSTTSVDKFERKNKEIYLFQNTPNPFNISTSLSFSINQKQNIEISIYNILGEKVKTLLSESLLPGNYSIPWNGLNKNGKEVSTGQYFFTIKGETRFFTKKMLLIR
ncbi:MAG: T9SS type A sorting domain-containing protein [Candidatus Latescibacteria bacterium]|jgi:photosystem II stability/assembly factor-like uncharacterized protein|nr:T9SS type A sorting domain-containing protein [Candidatus Latescibacterota bacterium]